MLIIYIKKKEAIKNMLNLMTEKFLQVRIEMKRLNLIGKIYVTIIERPKIFNFAGQVSRSYFRKKRQIIEENIEITNNYSHGTSSHRVPIFGKAFNPKIYQYVIGANIFYFIVQSANVKKVTKIGYICNKYIKKKIRLFFKHFPWYHWNHGHFRNKYY